MTLNADQYLDPIIVLERKEQARLRKDAQCGNCVNASTRIFTDEPFCKVRYQTYGYRCKFYQRKDAK